MLTEEEAKTKWCPFARVAGRTTSDNAAQGCNRNYTGGPDSGGLCIGSACMAWRWKARFGTDPVNPENCAQLEPMYGYCGLAGRPE